MTKTIEVQPDKQGRIIATVNGVPVEVDQNMFHNGTATITRDGAKYQLALVAPKPKNIKTAKGKGETTQPEVKFIETKVKI